ncbi:M56 family metallopeptidase [Candidatus Palauibacter sp.]|uniref:M56 family metallopeptidase n=1 Tax=Candidatus Palauibacter sp. TaxID=3101350 RepID=UPI003B5A6A19
MTDLALQIAGSKLAISVVLGGMVWLLQRRNDRTRLSHALCLTLLAALLVPPLISIPVFQPALPPPGSAVAVGFGELQSVTLTEAPGGGWFAGHGGSGLVLAWVFGAVAVLGWTLARAWSFRRSLKVASREASPDLRRMAEDVARTLGLAKLPAIHTTDALVSPMAYWNGGVARVLIPSALLKSMAQAELRWILAHELAHVRRRDHLVRWLEWLACTVFWWNPVAWWTRRRLRAAGEVCCDALVLRALGGAPRDYARALVRAIELVRTERTRRPPAFASAADSGHRTQSLERRLRMIMTSKPAPALPPALRAVLRCGLVALLAAGLVYCGERTSPTAIEVPVVDLPLAGLHTGELEVVEVPPAERWAVRVPEDPEAIVIEARNFHFTWDAKSTVPRSGLVVVDYDERVPLRQNEELWAAIAELPASAQDAKFLVARQTANGGWVFLDSVPEGFNSTIHLMTYGPRSSGVELLRSTVLLRRPSSADKR